MLFLVETMITKRIFKVIEAKDKFESWDKAREILEKDKNKDEDIQILGSREINPKDY